MFLKLWVLWVAHSSLFERKSPYIQFYLSTQLYLRRDCTYNIYIYIYIYIYNIQGMVSWVEIVKLMILKDDIYISL